MPRTLVRRTVVIILLGLAAVASADAQTSRTRAKKPAARPSTSRAAASAAKVAAPVREAPLMQCPSILGNGITTQRLYCDVLGGADPAAGLRITLPPHTGPLTLAFALHNRQTYSESEVKAGRAFARYTAMLKVASGTGEMLGEAVVRNEFRTEKDLVERIGGGAGPGGVKAVAPTGVEQVVLTVPDTVGEVVITGARLTIERIGGTEVVTAPGRPYAVISGVEIEYRPAPPPPPPKPRRQRR
ncbi:MAG: hypothetical protein ABIT71_25980 [Vicinamibacteraceae bacterium]